MTTGDLYKNVSGSQLYFGSTDFGPQTDHILLYIYIDLNWIDTMTKGFVWIKL